MQAGGCGEQGEHLTLPLTFLALNSSDQGGQVAREWAAYRYGVFPEAGFPEDPLYPATYLEGQESLANSGCPGQLFCPLRHPQSPLAPTKQNLLCGGRSALEVLLSNKDFSGSTRHQVYNLPGQPLTEREQIRDTTFRYVEAAPPNIVLVLDQSGRMGRRRWDSVKRALYRFIGLLAEGTSLAIVVYGETASLVLPPTTVTEEKREGLHGRVPRRVLEQSLAAHCLKCGLELAASTLRKAGGSVVLVTRDDGALAGSVLEEVNSASTQLFSLAFPAFESSVISPLASLSTYYRVNEATSSLSSLTSSLLDVLNRVTPGQAKVQKLFESRHQQHKFTGSFFIEEDLRTDIVVTLSIDDEQKIEFFEVSDSSGKKNIFSKFEDGLVLFRFPGESEPGVWSFRAKLYPDSALPTREMMVEVVARGRGEAVLVSGLSLLREGVPVVAARVSKGHLPVYGAEVVATVSGPGGSVDVVLQDSGLAFPDITAGDSIYSGYLPTFSPVSGPLTVAIRATEGAGSFTSPGRQDVVRCCGSRREHGRQDPTGKFSRYTASPVVVATLTSPNGTDMSPPSRIPDLRLLSTNTTTESILLSWTAPGGDFDQGRATGYLVGCHTDPAYLNDTNFATKAIFVHAAESLSALPYGSMETLEAGVPYTGQLFYYAVVGVDSAGNRGPVSNLVAAFMEEVTTRPPTTEAVPTLPTELVQAKDQLVLGAVLAGSFLVLVSLLVLCVVARGRRASVGKAHRQEDTYQTGGYLPDMRSSKVREAEGCEGVYSWLETLPRSEGEASSGGSGVSPTGTVTEGDSVSDSHGGEEPAELVHGYENFDAAASAGASPMPDKYASEIFNRSKQYFSVRGVSGSIVEAVADETASVRLANSYISMRPADTLSHLSHLADSPSHMLPPPPPAHRRTLPPAQQRRKRHESVV